VLIRVYYLRYLHIVHYTYTIIYVYTLATKIYTIYILVNFLFIVYGCTDIKLIIKNNVGGPDMEVGDYYPERHWREV